MSRTNVDFLIIGQGLAGSALAMALLQRGKSICVVDRGDTWGASRVAAGLVTSAAGKGMNPAWRQAEYLPIARAYYAFLEKKHGRQLFHEHNVLRLFDDAKQQAKFERKCDKLKGWVSEKQPEIDHDHLHAEDGAFEMLQSGRLDTVAYLQLVRELVEKQGAYRVADFQQEAVRFSSDGIAWEDVEASKLILCQGAFGLGKGWFADVPHRSAKGEMLTVKIADLPVDRIINRNGWLVPIGDELWRAGATYQWDDLNGEVTQRGREEVEEKVASLIKLDFETVAHQAGVRPIIRRSQPVIGFHPEIPQLGFFNGLGSKGVITAPSVAAHFADHLCHGDVLDEELALSAVMG